MGDATTSPFWTESAAAVCTKLDCGQDGLSAAEADRRLLRYGQNADVQNARTGMFRTIFRRLIEPLSLILLVAAIVSAGTGDVISGSIIAVILILSIGLDTVQEGHAAQAADVLRKSVALTAEVRRQGAYIQKNSANSSWLRLLAAMVVSHDSANLPCGLSDLFHILQEEALAKPGMDGGEMNMVCRLHRKSPLEIAIEHLDERLPLTLLFKPDQ